MKQHRGVVVGCGNIGALWGLDTTRLAPASHAAAIQANPRTELVGLVDIDEAVLEKAASVYGAPAYQSVSNALEQRPDFVVIATPPATHEALLAELVTSDVPLVVCEKPLSDNLAAAGRMVEMVRNNPSRILVDYQRRFFPLYKEARRRIAQGELGEIREMRGVYNKGLLNNGSHLIDAIHYLTGRCALWAQGQCIGYEGEALGTLHTAPDITEQHDLLLVGTKGTLNITDLGYRFEWGSGEVQLDRRSMLEPTIAHVVECLDGTPPLCEVEDGYTVARVIDALERSAKKGNSRISI